jgi:hypothetical protein
VRHLMVADRHYLLEESVGEDACLDALRVERTFQQLQVVSELQYRRVAEPLVGFVFALRLGPADGDAEAADPTRGERGPRPRHTLQEVSPRGLLIKPDRDAALYSTHLHMPPRF